MRSYEETDQTRPEAQVSGGRGGGNSTRKTGRGQTFTVRTITEWNAIDPAPGRKHQLPVLSEDTSQKGKNERKPRRERPLLAGKDTRHFKLIRALSLSPRCEASLN